MYIAYLDEFGHIGPFTGRNQQKYNENPLFGLGGIVLPATGARRFATWFFQLKSNLLGREIRRSGETPYTWEKKGAQLYTTTNILKYRQLRTATNRILNQVEALGGKCVYVGLEKYSTPEEHDANRLYLAVLRETFANKYYKQLHYWRLMDYTQAYHFRQNRILRRYIIERYRAHTTASDGRN